MTIKEVKIKKQDAAIAELLRVWESSVRATHSFLSEREIGRIKEYVPEALRKTPHLLVAEEDGELVAFAGISGRKLEMLFVAADKRGRGIGKKLLQCAIDERSVNELTVNEQNKAAIGFYEHMGFKAYARSDTDERGGPYPILFMKKI